MIIVFDWSIFNRRDTISFTATHAFYPPDWAQFLLCYQSISHVCSVGKAVDRKSRCLQWAKEARGPSGAIVSRPYHPCLPFHPPYSCLCFHIILPSLPSLPSLVFPPITTTLVFPSILHIPSSEDEALRQLYLACTPGKEGRTWTTLAKAMSGRSSKQCYDRW